MALMGITGNINVPGGQVLFKTPNIVKVSTFGAHKQLPKEQVAKRLGGERFRLAGKFGIINPKCVWDAVLNEKPYPVKMIFLISSNPLLTRAKPSEVYRALEKIEFLAVSDFKLLTKRDSISHDVVTDACQFIAQGFCCQARIGLCSLAVIIPSELFIIPTPQLNGFSECPTQITISILTIAISLGGLV